MQSITVVVKADLFSILLFVMGEYNIYIYFFK